MLAPRIRPATSSDRRTINGAPDHGEKSLRRLGVYSLGFLKQPALRRALGDAGWRVAPLGASASEAVGVWGRKPVSRRGLAAAERAGVPVLTIEDGFLRSVAPGGGAPVLSLLLDDLGVHYDASAPSRLEQLIAAGEGDVDRARAGIARLRDLRLSKYNASSRMRNPPSDHVLVIDQTRGDASIAGGGADAASFAAMLAAAEAENPNADIIIKSHPETARGAKPGHFGREHEKGGVRLIAEDTSPWDLIEGARAVYTVTSQMGFEALIAGKPVRTFGAPFYAGWDATDDAAPQPERRGASRTPEQIFAAAYIDYPHYFDPYDGGLSDFESALGVLALWRDAAAEGRKPAICSGMRLWKRAHIAGFVSGEGGGPLFEDDPIKAAQAARDREGRMIVWAGKETAAHRDEADRAGVSLSRMEDGFLRSVGLGAELAPPLSLIVDDLGVYYDPTRESRLERLISAAPEDAAALERAARLRRSIVEQGVTKYNLAGERGAERPGANAGKSRVILVPGQVADDASLRFGAGDIADNLSLLRETRRRAPDAMIIYKPHPDVEAGLRVGAIPRELALEFADEIAAEASASEMLEIANEVWTMTSLLGFEALLRGKPVTTFGAPFYAGWGLAQDFGPIPERRKARPALDQLVHAALIDYPAYIDPVSGLRCPPEVIVRRLASGRRTGGRVNGALSKLQGAFAGWSRLWR